MTFPTGNEPSQPYYIAGDGKRQLHALDPSRSHTFSFLDSSGSLVQFHVQLVQAQTTLIEIAADITDFGSYSAQAMPLAYNSHYSHTRSTPNRKDEIRDLVNYVDCNCRESLQVRTNEPNSSKLVPHLVKKIIDGQNLAETQTKLEKWWDWYLNACMHVAKDALNNKITNRASHGAFIINKIVNELLPTDGKRALAVYVALARTNYRISQVADTLKRCDIPIFVRTVAANLRDKLTLPELSHVFFPAFWISSALKQSYGKICLDIGFPNFSHYPWTQWPEPYQYNSMSLIKEEWTLFISIIQTQQTSHMLLEMDASGGDLLGAAQDIADKSIRGAPTLNSAQMDFEEASNLCGNTMATNSYEDQAPAYIDPEYVLSLTGQHGGIGYIGFQ